MDAYALYGNKVKQVRNLAVRVAAGRGLPANAEPLAPTTAATGELASAEDERARSWESVLLLGEPATVAAARAWHHSVWRVTWFARGLRADPKEWLVALRDSEDARRKFYDCARRDLGVAGRAVPAPPQPLWAPARSPEQRNDDETPEAAAALAEGIAPGQTTEANLGGDSL